MAQPSESQIAEVYLDNWNPDGGWVRTQAQEEVGREERGDYSAVFYLVHAIHGKFDAKEALDDNASLLVLKIEPKTTDPSKTFLRFKVTLKCTRTRSSVEHPYIAAADPALGGERVLDDFIINKSKDLSYGASLSAQGSAVPLSGGVNMSKSQGETYNLRERHTISARVDKTNARSVRDCAWWELRAAPTASQGIGDFFTVAVVIHRSKGQQFTITADTEADLGGISDKLRRFEGIFHRRKEGTPLGTYGPVGNKPMTPTPAGIDPNNLRCSTDSPEVVRKSLCVGVHLPETEAPLATLGTPLSFIV
ncbi:hypothetical protein F4819DRAFT_143226 [Hypoxylon fuscum]|nr:hypothetical protein F4819DRAFT_143226 [Hypoxylon fuscum]